MFIKSKVLSLPTLITAYKALAAGHRPIGTGIIVGL